MRGDTGVRSRLPSKPSRLCVPAVGGCPPAREELAPGRTERPGAPPPAPRVAPNCGFGAANCRRLGAVSPCPRLHPYPRMFAGHRVHGSVLGAEPGRELGTAPLSAQRFGLDLDVLTVCGAAPETSGIAPYDGLCGIRYRGSFGVVVAQSGHVPCALDRSRFSATSRQKRSGLYHQLSPQR